MHVREHWGSSDHGEQREQLVIVDGGTTMQVTGEHLIHWTHSRIPNYITSANIQIGPELNNYIVYF